MKIVDIKTHELRVPLLHPLKISLGVVTHALTCITEVITDDGLIGYGEGCAAPLITGETLSGVIENINAMKEKLIGVDPRDLEKVTYLMNRTAAYSGGAKAAIDIACYDLLSKSANLPLYKMLGGLSNTIETDMTVSIDNPDVMAEKAKAHVDAGFKVIKTKVGAGFHEDIARIKAIREAVGSDIKIRLDANQAWRAKEAVNIIERLNEYDIELVEQPVARFDFEGLKYVTSHSPVAIMADESCWDSKDAMHLASERAVDYINIKLMKCGGLHEAIKIINIAESAGIECMLGCMGEESGLAITAAASLGSAIRNVTRADLDGTFSMSEVPYNGGFSVENTNTLVLPETPGLGITSIKEELFSK